MKISRKENEFFAIEVFIIVINFIEDSKL